MLHKSVLFLVAYFRYHALIQKENEECFLMFRHFHLNRNQLECRVAEVLTAAAGGEDKYPTAHRMLISSQEIADEDIERLLPLLHLTNSKIIRISSGCLKQPKD